MSVDGGGRWPSGSSSRMVLAFGSLPIMVIVVIQVISAVECYDNQPSAPSVVRAAINTRHKVDYQTFDFTDEKPYVPNLIEVKSSVPSVMIKFNSASSKVNVLHQHQSSSPTAKETFSEDEPHIMRHQVIKPIIQEVHEIISPFRKIVQQVQPVQEEINTIVAKNSGGGGAGMHQSTYQSPPINFSPPKLERPIAPPLSPLRPPPPTPIIHQSNNGLLSHQAVNGGNGDYDDPQGGKKEPDLILNENELIDNSLYNGNNEFDLKYVSPNRLDGPGIGGGNHRLYEDR